MHNAFGFFHASVCEVVYYADFCPPVISGEWWICDHKNGELPAIMHCTGLGLVRICLQRRNQISLPTESPNFCTPVLVGRMLKHQHEHQLVSQPNQRSVSIVDGEACSSHHISH